MGKPIAENGKLQLDDNKPGMGLTLKTEGLEHFNIIEYRMDEENSDIKTF